MKSLHSASPALDDRIARLRRLAQAEPRLDGVLLYGSWTVGEADAHSDIEAYLYVQDEHVDTFDGTAWRPGLGGGGPLGGDRRLGAPR